LFVWERVEREDEEKLKETKQNKTKNKKTGVRQLVRAEKTQRAGRLVLCIMLLAAMVLFMLLIILLRAIF
jgi:type IV secretory pathway component VirB8